MILFHGVETALQDTTFAFKSIWVKKSSAKVVFASAYMPMKHRATPVDKISFIVTALRWLN